MIGYSRAGMACAPNTVFIDDSFEVTLPDDADSGRNIYNNYVRN